ncbi:hydrophobin [Trichoderma sp. SZMC 28014]
MKFSIIAFATGAFAAVCPTGIYSNPQCCGANVLGVAAVDCHTPRAPVLTGANFQAVCAAEGGKEALCCALPVAGQDVLCENPIGAV